MTSCLFSKKWLWLGSLNVDGFYAPGLKDSLGHLVIGSSVCLSVCPSVCPPVRNSVPLTNKVQYLKFRWCYSNQTWTVSSFIGSSHFTIWRALSKPPQRRQGPDPRPLWLLVGTPSAFRPELAYRLRVAQPTLMDVPIFLIYFYITIYVYLPHFYDLSALVGCWSSVSIRRIIYNFLNVCPFDNTAVAVSGKVERS